MILVLDDEVQPDYRYLAPEIDRILPESDYHVYAEDTDIPPLDEYDGVLISGSTASVYDDSHPWIDEQCDLVEECVEREIPLLGVCFGHQLVNWALGGDVEADVRRATFVEMEILEEDEVLEGIEPVVPVLHADLVTDRGEGMVATARTDYSENFCTRHESAPVWTVQFHPEFTERVVDRPSDWDAGDHSFDECNAHEVLTNFARACTRRVEA
jgi:GMP synthase (glutamine-hydrolysing)